ncbi:soluble lytic murein transglycosylase [Ectothiorhodosinus mongolicus]|uniref:Soluble lytic murein transglycosylase n=2 Tax=Ectothiorhodosinus mongolicus TaxID=233100 RepID=A0A1R3VYL5_9GAMM|nr:soluble lytic murein transglycosylase [Ectothiorhodosinus mongolicus]
MLCLPLMAAAEVSERDRQRALFLAAETALEQGQRTRFNDLSAELSDYPLLPYLEYAALKRQLSRATPKAIESFAERWPDSPLAPRLRQAWLQSLADRQQWTLLAEADVSGASTTILCTQRQALLRLGRRDEALQGVEDLWRVGRSQPRACDSVFEAWRAQGGPDTDLGWARFTLAMQEHQLGLARYLRRYLSEADRPSAEQWLRLAEHPTELRRQTQSALENPHWVTITPPLMQRLARRDPRQALEIWEQRQSDWALPEDVALDLERFIAFRLTLRERNGALNHLASLRPEVFDDTLRQWQLRSALSIGDWETVLLASQSMSHEAQQQAIWQYWRARALEATGERAAARESYALAAEQRNYYGFLAADRLQQAYRLGHRPLVVDADALAQVSTMAPLQRALELKALDRDIDARREWLALQNQINGQPDALVAAAHLAHLSGWHDRAIFAVARAQEFDDIDLRFPMAFADLIAQHASAQGINPAWAFAVTRQESAFMTDAHSSAGALGLMQIMPHTGRTMGRTLGTPVSHRLQLLDPELNIRIGAAYLKRNLENFGGHVILSTAAYNAGARRVRQWLPETGAMDADIWVELIPFAETRQYVQRILAYQLIYELRLGQELTTLSRLMPPITSMDDLPASRLAHYQLWASDNAPGLPVAIVCDAPGYNETPC